MVFRSRPFRQLLFVAVAPSRTYDVLVYADGERYYAEDKNGNIICVDSPTACIQESINYLSDGGVIKLSKGVFRIQSPISLKTNTYIEGEGPELTVLLNIGDKDNLISITGSGNTWIRELGLSKLTIHGNRDFYRVNRCIYLNQFLIVRLDDVEVFGCSGDAVVVDGNPWSSFLLSTRMNIHDNTGRGLVLMGELNMVSIDTLLLRYNASEPLYITSTTSETFHDPWQVHIKTLLTEYNHNVSVIASNPLVKIDYWWADTDHGIYIPAKGGVIVIDKLFFGSKSSFPVNIDNGATVIGDYWLLGYAIGASPGMALRVVNSKLYLRRLDLFSSTGIELGGNYELKIEEGSYATKKSGTATILAGSTSVTVNHGLICTPSKVFITPRSQPPGQLWVSNITDVSFTINISTPPTTDLPVTWYAEC
jgi:hypothetical protein